MASRSLVGAVIERNPLSGSSGGTTPKSASSGKTGFPAVQHRSKSAFARGRDEQRNGVTEKVTGVPQVIPTRSGTQPDEDVTGSGFSATDSLDWRRQISVENERLINRMTKEELEQAKGEVVEQFGSELLARVSQARKRRAEQMQPAESTKEEKAVGKEYFPDESHPSGGLTEVSGMPHLHGKLPTRSPPPALSTSSSRPSSRADRKLRFADITPNDIHVYESAPPSPRKKILALPPPDPSDRSTISLRLPATNPQKPVPNSQPDGKGVETDTEEGTPDYIRRRYFPDAPTDDPTVAWMKLDQEPNVSSTSLRFDLTGAPIPPSLASTLPTHLGLHHHSDGVHAGYTLDDIFLLSRSSVPAQRATMLGVLAHIARRLGKSRQTGDVEMSEIKDPEELRKRMVAAGLEAMNERGSLGVRAVELVFECIVRWDEDLLEIEGIELGGGGEKRGGSPANTDAISSLPLEYILSQISTSFALPTLPNESLVQLLAVLHRFAQHSNGTASAIVSTKDLVYNVLQIFLLTPIPPSEASFPPNPAALQFLITLAQSSRANASTLVGFADTLLRFLTMLPPTSPHPIPLTNVLLSSTLRFYSSLASYGLYTHVAATVAAPLAQLRSYLLSLQPGPESNPLLAAWVELIEAWTVCATDPHQTTPTHSILWSQVVGCGWNEEVLEFRDKLSTEHQDWEVWEMVWRAEAAWLEGARVNCVMGGREERETIFELVQSGFEHGKEKDIVARAIEGLKRGLDEFQPDEGSARYIDRLRGLAPYANTLAALVRFWLACVPPLSDRPLVLPFVWISDVCAKLATHPFWTVVLSDTARPYICTFVRPLTTLLSVYLNLSKRLPDTSDHLWMTQAFVILSRLIPGDEEMANQIVEEVAARINPLAMASHGWDTPAVIWNKGGLEIIKPFLRHTIQPTEATFIGPKWMSPRSIMSSTTQRLPPWTSNHHGVGGELGLPLADDWTLSPIDHLLSSGSSSVFKSMPSSWDASETEIVRASLLLTKVFQAVLQQYSMRQFALTREEVVFGCMKIFMLEHEQPQNDSSDEVFRDDVVRQFMEDLLASFTIAAQSSSFNPPRPLSNPREDLEKVASRLLGSATPFYQYYTDFLALYDAVSFAHPLFARLLLPPTALRYPLDYRKHLWNDFRHLLRTVRVAFDQVIASNVGEYLWPIDNDPHMIGAYLGALMREPLRGFVRLIAIHHISCNIWPDLREDETEGNERSMALLKSVVGQGDVDAVRDVVLYRQSMDGPILLPPKCFEEEGPWKESRMNCIKSWGSGALAERLGDLLHGPSQS